MKWICLTGGMGCGKSTALSFFKSQGFSVASADQVVKELYERPEVVLKVSQILGLDPEGFSKEAVAQVVFSDKAKLQQLENLLHPLVRMEVDYIRKEFEKQKKEVAFYEVPLLFEKNMQNLFDKTLCIGASVDVQRERIKKRNPLWSDVEIKGRLAAQMPLIEKKDLSDFYIDNSMGLKELESSCLEFLDGLFKGDSE